MLDIERNRLDYGHLLVPPDGYQLSKAVATAYSVDLDTLLSIPVALYYAQTLEGQLQGKDVHMIRAIQNTARCLTIFHQAGQVRVPRAAKNIYAYFEDSLAPILPGDAFTSFHPKTWLLRYQHKESSDDIVYRLIVLSRNLTFDRSWDVAACMEGKPEAEPLAKNKPLVDFHAWLHEQRPLENGTVLLKELARVRFDKPDSFDGFAFHPIGIPGYSSNPVASKRAQRLLCLSPFLHPEAMDELWHHVEQIPMILSSRGELERLSPELLGKFNCYCLSDAIVDGEHFAAAEEGAGEAQQQNLHAKVFLFDDSSKTTWFLGSANATKAAFQRNVEFMLELKGSAAAVRWNTVRKQLLGNDDNGNMFVSFDPADGGQETKKAAKQREALRSLEYDILMAPMKGQVTPAENQTNFDLSLSIDLRNISAKSEFTVSARPFVRLAEDQFVQFSRANQFDYYNFSETSLSRFVHFTIRAGDETLREFLVRIEVAGIPTSRLDNIFKSIIDSRDKFFAYLRFLLTDELTKEDIEDQPPTGTKKTAGDGHGGDFDMPIFEQLLVTASRNPRRLWEVDRVIASLCEGDGKKVVPQDFLSLWEVFKVAVPRVEGNDE